MFLKNLFFIISFSMTVLFADSSLYYKNMIKNRSKIHPESYNYAVIRKKSDLYKVKNSKFKPNKSKKVYNYVEIKNVKQNIFNRSVNNIGLNLNSTNKRKIVNIVKIKNSSINGNSQLGVKIKTKKNKKFVLRNTKIDNRVTLKDSDIGSRKERMTYKLYQLMK